MEKFKAKFEAIKGNLVLSGFDTQHDLQLAIKALDRLCYGLAGEVFLTSICFWRNTGERRQRNENCKRDRVFGNK